MKLPIKIILTITSIVFCITIFSCEHEELIKGSTAHIMKVTESVNDDLIVAGLNESGNWLTYGGNYQEDRYSPLAQINKDNIKELGLAWATELGTNKGLQATPLVVDGIMFFSGPKSVMFAFDARTGKQIWKYDAKVNPDQYLSLCCGMSNRGLAMYEGDLFMGTLDGRLISVDAATGTLNWEVMTIPEEGNYSITGAPRIANGKVIIGNGGAEMGARGYVTAYDAKTGDQKWRFYTVPGDPSKPYENPILEEAAKTWSGSEYWKQGGGGTVWDAIVYDPELDLLYIGVGNGAHWDRELRSPGGGDNLFLSSIVALNPNDGSYVWHFQTTPGDTWDYTATQHIILADIEIEGKPRKVLMQAPKNGFFYVLDRTDGTFISGEKIGYINWATGLDAKGRPIEAEGARYTDGQVHWISPSSQGVHNWNPMSYSHQTGLVYIPTNKESGPYLRSKSVDDPGAVGSALDANVTIAGKLYVPNVFDPNPAAPMPFTLSSRLVAWDPIQQKEAWGIDQPTFNNGGLLSTAGGLVFQGDAAGMFTARDAQTGEALWEYDIRSGAIAPPITYTIDGEQYVSILVGWGGHMGKLYHFVDRIHPGTLFTFKIGGTAQALEKLPALDKPLTALRDNATPEQIGTGWNTWVQYCVFCHPSPGSGDAANPDLARSSDGVLNNLKSIVLEGTLVENGMPSFAGIMTEEELESVKCFILYSSKVLGEGMSPTDYLTSIAQMQYLADQKNLLKD